jgi:exodeoxyribonuclease VII small subunit
MTRKGSMKGNGEAGDRRQRRWTGRAGSGTLAPMSKTKGTDTSTPDLQNLPFEDALKRLEAIVESMEAQDLPLETLLARYEEGAALSRHCQGKLNEAELKIQQLEKSAKGELALKPLEGAEEPK